MINGQILLQPYIKCTIAVRKFLFCLRNAHNGYSCYYFEIKYSLIQQLFVLEL